MSEYVGITIGPIFETLQLAETPAALWYASTSFSELARLLLQQITEQIPDAKIVAPYYDGTKYTDGLGRYSDHILLETASAEKLPAVIDAAKTAMVEMVLSDINPTEDKKEKYWAYLERYFQIHYVVVHKAQRKQEMILSEVSPLLDAIECMPRCNPSRESNPFKMLFSAKSDDARSRNSRIKASALLRGVTDSQLLLKDGSLKSIEDICNGSKDLKKSHYFAVVSADGDGMFSLFSKKNNEEARIISEKCFAFTEAAAMEIKKFGGMTIYAGGDDLLFLAPVQSAEGETVFELCNRLSDIFSDKVAGKQPSPSMSFGVAIRYMRFPLYEALNAAFAALANAKGSRPKKNTIAIDLQKHSGQFVTLYVAKEGFYLFNKTMQQVLQQSSDAVNSIIYVLEKFSSSIYADSPELRNKNINVFINNYDNESQAEYLGYVRILAEQFCELLENKELITTGEKGRTELKCFEAILRVGKFFVERGSENE